MKNVSARMTETLQKFTTTPLHMPHVCTVEHANSSDGEKTKKETRKTSGPAGGGGGD